MIGEQIFKVDHIRAAKKKYEVRKKQTKKHINCYKECGVDNTCAGSRSHSGYRAYAVCDRMEYHMMYAFKMSETQKNE
jgi:hypothetical protein